MYRGDVALGQTVNSKFCTVQASGAPTTLSGSPAVRGYVGNSTTELNGVTLSVDFDGVTGLNNLNVVLSGGNSYAAQTDVEMVITAGTVNSVSAVGYVVAAWSIENRSSLRPTVAGRTADIASTGEIGLDFANVTAPASGATAALGIVAFGTASALPSAGSLTLEAGQTFGTDALKDRSIWIFTAATTGKGQCMTINSNTNASPSVVSFDAPTIAIAGAVVYVIFATPASSTTNPPSVSIPDGALTSAKFADGFLTAAKIAADAITAAKIADGAIDAATFAANAITATVLAAGAITNAKFAAGAIDATAIAADAIAAAKIATGALTAAKFAANSIDAAALAADAASEIATACWAAATRILTAGTNIGVQASADAAITANAVIGAINTNAFATALQTAPAAIRAALGLASADLDTQLDALAILMEGLSDRLLNESDEPTTVPAADAAAMDKLDYVFMRIRNRSLMDKTTGQVTLFADDGVTAMMIRNDVNDADEYVKEKDLTD